MISLDDYDAELQNIKNMSFKKFIEQSGLFEGNTTRSDKTWGWFSFGLANCVTFGLITLILYDCYRYRVEDFEILRKHDKLID